MPKRLQPRSPLGVQEHERIERGTSILASEVENVPVVLVVDDDDEVRLVACAHMEALGLRILEASSGIQALDLVDHELQVDILFSDVCMPGMSGAELAEEVKRRRPDMQVILASGYMFSAETPYTVVPKPYRRRDLELALAPLKNGLHRH